MFPWLEVLSAAAGTFCGVMAISLAIITYRMWRNAREDGATHFHMGLIEPRHTRRY